MRERILQTIRNALIALATVLLGLLGYHETIARPHMEASVAALGKTTNLHALNLRDDLTVGDDLTVADDVTFSSDVIQSGTGKLRVVPSTPQPVATGTPIAPERPLWVISAAAACTANGISPGAAGDLLIIYNSSANAVTLTDAGTLKLAANAVLGQFDTLTLVSDGTNWIEVARADN